MHQMKPEEIVKTHAMLCSNRSNLDTVLQDVEEYVVPFRGEFEQEMLSETTVQWDRKEIYDSTAVHCNDALASQMQGYITNPSAKFFGFEFRDDDLNDDVGAKEWLEACEDRVWQAISESDFDTECAEMYLDLPSFATAFLFQEEVGEDLGPFEGIDFTAVPVADSQFQCDPNGVCYRYFRKMRFTQEELEDRFGDLPEAFKPDEGGTDGKSVEYEVVFCVYRRNDNDPMGVYLPKDRPVGYQYVLKKQSLTLEEGGYYHFPVMVPRWGITAGSDWGHGPAMRLLADIKQLNETVAMVTEARAKAIDPPILGQESSLVGDVSLASGELTLVTNIDGLKPFHTFSNFVEAEKEIVRLRETIRDGFYLPRLEYKDSPQMTAHEVERRHQRMLRMMAPMLGRLKRDLLDPVVMNTFYLLMRKGELPEQPEIVAQADLDIVYKGELPRAQNQDIGNAIEATFALVAEYGETYPELRDRFDEDAGLRELSLIRGLPMKVLRTDDEVEKRRAARAEAQEQARKIEMMRGAGEALGEVGQGMSAVREGSEGIDPSQLQNVIPMQGSR